MQEAEVLRFHLGPAGDCSASGQRLCTVSYSHNVFSIICIDLNEKLWFYSRDGYHYYGCTCGCFGLQHGPVKLPQNSLGYAGDTQS